MINSPDILCTNLRRRIDRTYFKFIIYIRILLFPYFSVNKVKEERFIKKNFFKYEIFMIKDIEDKEIKNNENKLLSSL